jgi:cob(I)alamin adenosyltransferase
MNRDVAAGRCAQQSERVDDHSHNELGFVHVYTGAGKGKTTAAFGLALRAAGHGKRVWVGQFMKGRPSGEVTALRDNPLIHVEQFDSFCLVDGSTRAPASRERANAGRARSAAALASGDYDVVVLDEIDVAVWFGLLTEQECVDLLDARPASVELVMTGRWAPQAVVERADLVTEMREVKHYYQRGVQARAGIEY